MVKWVKLVTVCRIFFISADIAKFTDGVTYRYTVYFQFNINIKNEVQVCFISIMFSSVETKVLNNTNTKVPYAFYIHFNLFRRLWTFIFQKQL